LRRSGKESASILLVIVARHDPALYEFLQHRLTDIEGVQIIVERRQGERRQQRQPAERERRRQGDRRQPRRERRYVGYTFVWLDVPAA